MINKVSWYYAIKGTNMELIEINGRRWQKYRGEEGQDVYIAEFVESGESVLGQYADETSYDILIDCDADFYLPAECDMEKSTTCDRECINCLDESRVAFKFRKNVFTQEEQDGAYKGLWGAAIESNNRGLAAGPREESQGNRDWVTGYQHDVLKWFAKGQPINIDGSDPVETFLSKHHQAGEEIRGGVWLRTKIEPEYGDYKNFFPKMLEKLQSMTNVAASKEAKRVLETMISATSYATAIWSGIAGFYGRYPRIPYGRATAYTDHNREQFELCYPFARKLDQEFARMLPNRYAAQKQCADAVDKKFLIGEDTTFTTITVNTTTAERNARMACHRDAGSLNKGFSNLTVISDGKKDWNGGYLVAPEVRVAINVRPGDLLLIDNMRIIHGNTPIESPVGKSEEDLLRMSLVFYFREDVLKLGSWEYEHLRRSFVDYRRLNQDHPLWRPYWNGVSPAFMEDTSEEWYNYLTSTGGKDIMLENQPGLWHNFNSKNTLEDFF